MKCTAETEVLYLVSILGSNPTLEAPKTLNTIHGAHERNLNYAQLELGAS